MRKTKRLSALILGSAMTISSMPALSAGAYYHASEYTELNKYLDDFFAIPRIDGELYSDSPRSGEHSTFYISKSNHNLSIEVYDTESTYIKAKLNGDADIEEVEKAIYDICPDAYISTMSVINGDLVIYAKGFAGELAFEEAKQKNITLEQASRIREKFDDISVIKSFDYISPEVAYDNHERYLTHYCNTPDGVKEKVEQFILDNDLKCHFEPFSFIPGEVSSYHFLVVPDEDITTEEHYELANLIYKEIGLVPYIEYLQTSHGTSETSIDLHSNVKGDANDDGKLALSDAITIMQKVGNPDTFGLTAQGEYNADIAGNFDGITNADALAVQKKLLNIE